MDNQTQLNCCHDYEPMVDPYTGVSLLQQCIHCHNIKSIIVWHFPNSILEEPQDLFNHEWKIENPPGPIVSTHWPFD